MTPAPPDARRLGRVRRYFALCGWRAITGVDLASSQGAVEITTRASARGRPLEGQDEPPHTRIPDAEAMVVDELLPDRHRAASGSTSRPSQRIASLARRLLINDDPGFVVCGGAETSVAGLDMVAAQQPDVAVIDRTLGASRRGGNETAPLSNRERHVLTLFGRGLSTREIARQLKLSVKIVESHCARIKEKLSLRTGRELIRVAVHRTEGQPL